MKLLTSDNQIIELNYSIVKYCNVLNQFFEENCNENLSKELFILKDITYNTMRYVVLFFQYFFNGDNNTLNDYSNYFYILKVYNQLFDVLYVSHFLDINPLYTLLCKHISLKIKNKCPDEIEEIFNVKLSEYEKSILMENCKWS